MLPSLWTSVLRRDAAKIMLEEVDDGKGREGTKATRKRPVRVGEDEGNDSKAVLEKVKRCNYVLKLTWYY